MKLRNFMYATMIACAFASCSKDEVEIDKGTDGDATLNVQVLSPISVKSIGDAAVDDETINTLNVYVFNGDVLEATGTLTDAATKESKGIKVSAGQKSVVVLANASTTEKTLTGLKAATKDFSTEVNGTLSMNSQIYTIDVVAGKTNYLGYSGTDNSTNHYLPVTAEPVKLFRNVAKIKLAEVKTVDNPKYPGGQLAISEVFILHGSKTTKLIGTEGAAWGSTFVSNGSYVNGVNNNIYGQWIVWPGLDSETKKQNYLPATTGLSTDANYSEAVNVVNKDNTTFYVYENTATAEDAIHTLLVVKGKYTYGNLNADQVEERYYPVAVGVDGILTGNSVLAGITRQDGGVLRNLQYNVELSVKGPGYDTPFGPDGGDEGNTALDVKVQVIGFGQVSQGAEVE